MKNNGFIFAVMIVAVALAPHPAAAYVDPGAGGLLLQLLLGGFAGLLIIGKLYWSQFKAFFSRKSDTPAEHGKKD